MNVINCLFFAPRNRLWLSLVSVLGLTIPLAEARHANAASIVWDSWSFTGPTVTSTKFAEGDGTTAPNNLQAISAASVFPFSPSSYFSETATTNVTGTSFFTVVPDASENVGDTVKGALVGNLDGFLGATGLDIRGLTGSYGASVTASVNAGFASWSSPGSGTAISGSVLILDAVSNPVKVPFNIPGILTIGQQYPFSMSLTTNATKTGAYQAISRFNDGLTANVVVVPTPALLPGLIGMGITAFRKRKRESRASIKTL